MSRRFWRISIRFFYHFYSYTACIICIIKNYPQIYKTYKEWFNFFELINCGIYARVKLKLPGGNKIWGGHILLSLTPKNNFIDVVPEPGNA
jgi:hypothetical protein